MADIIKFVDPNDWTTVRLDVNNGGDCPADTKRYWKQEGTEFPVPDPDQSWLEPDMVDGEELVSTRQPNRVITLVLLVEANTKPLLDTAMRELLQEINRFDNCIEYRPDGAAESLYYTTYQYMSIRHEDYFRGSSRDTLGAQQVTIEIPCYSWAESDEVDLDPVWCLGDDNSFEKNDGANLAFWDVVVTGGATWAKEVGAGNFLHGLQSLRMNCGAAETVTATEKTFIPVEELDHFDFHAAAKKLSGTGDVDYSLECYDDDSPPNLLGTVDVLTGDDPTASWLDRLSISVAQGIIYPSTSGETVKFETDTTQVKRVIKQSGLGTILFDNLYFANSEYAPGYKIRPTMGLNIIGDDIPGDVPADADLYFSHPYAQLCWRNFSLAGLTYIVGVAALDATHVWVLDRSGAVYFWNGSTWNFTWPIGGIRFTDIFAIDANNVWACCADDVYYFNGVAWDGGTTVKAGIDWQGLWGSAANSVWVVGDNGEIYFWNGAAWVAQVGGVVFDLTCIDGFAANNVLVGGDKGGGLGVIIRWNGAAWIDETPPGMTPVTAITSFDGGNAWAATQDTIMGVPGTLMYRYIGGGVWRTTWLPNIYITGLYAFSATDVWACGDDGYIMYFDGANWQRQCSDTSRDLAAVDGFDADNVWAVGYRATLVNWMSAEPVPFTDIFIGQRNDYHADYNPVVQPADGVRDYLYTRMDSDYYKIAAAATATARFLLAAHEGRYLITVGITFSDATANDKCTINLLLQTPDGTDITDDYVEIELDVGDPNTDWKEIVMLDPRFDSIPVPSHFARSDVGAIYQVIRVIADAGLGAVEEWLDHIAIIPIDYSYCEVREFDKNSLILSSRKQKAVLSSLDGTLGKAMVYDTSKWTATLKFVADPKGMNLTLVSIYDNAGDHEQPLACNMKIKYRPRWFLVKT